MMKEAAADCSAFASASPCNYRVCRNPSRPSEASGRLKGAAAKGPRAWSASAARNVTRPGNDTRQGQAAVLPRALLVRWAGGAESAGAPRTSTTVTHSRAALASLRSQALVDWL